jgi:hypothetical protein
MRDAKIEFIDRVGEQQRIKAKVIVGPHEYIAILVPVRK